jgi:hypothetical protein
VRRGEQRIRSTVQRRIDSKTVSIFENVASPLGLKVADRDVIEADGSYALREPVEAYGLGFASENEALRSQSTFFWNEIVDDAMT